MKHRAHTPAGSTRGARLGRIALGTAILGLATPSVITTADAQDAPAPAQQPAPAPQPATPQQETREAESAVAKTQSDIDRLLAEPTPSDVDGMIARLSEISHAATAVNDNVQRSEELLERSRIQGENATRSLDEAQRRADEALAQLAATQGDVTLVAQALYRGTTIDPVTAVAGATGPQAAIERASYMDSISHRTTRVLEGYDATLQEAADARSLALRTKASADFQHALATSRQKQLDEQQRTLEELKKRVMDGVNGLSPEDRQRWVDKNGPLDVDVKQFLSGPLSAAAGGAVGAAMSKLGSPYSWGAAGPSAFDCSGLMYWAYQQQGKTIPRTSQAQLAGGTPVSRADLQPGDIVAYYPGATHVGMYIGDGKLVHASDYGIPVQVVSVDSMPFVGAARY